MKRLIQAATALAVCFLLFAATSTTATAQEGMTNLTSCALTVKYEYGLTGSCISTGGGNITIPSGATFPILTPPGTSIIYAQGIDENQQCEDWSIQAPVSCVTQAFAGPTATVTGCLPCGGSYTVTYIAGFGLFAF